MVSVVDREFNTLVANKAVVAAFGRSRPEEVIGRKCYRVRKGLDEVCPHCGILQAFLTGAPCSRVSTAEEEMLLGLATKAYAIPLKNDAGEIWGGVEVIVDVTDLRQAERALRENEKRLRSLIEHAADAVYVNDLQGRITSANVQAAKQTGYTPEELLSMTIMDLDTQVSNLAQGRALWSQLDIGSSAQIESTHIRRDRSTFPVEINYSATEIQGNKHVIGFVRDVTDRKAAEEKLRFFRSAVESSTSAVSMASPDGLPWYQNRAFDELFGPLGEVPIAGMYVDQRVGREILQAIRAGGQWSGEVQMYGAQRQILSVSLNAYSLQGTEDQVTGLVFVHNDITDRKRAEKERLALERQIQQAQKLESLGILAGGIAHDFNNLLGGIFGYIDLALEDSLSEEVRRYLTKSMNTLDRARGLTRQLLTFAKGGAPAKKVQPLFPFIRDTAEFALSGSSVSCAFETPKNLWSCEYDENQLGQAIDNLVINAKQAMPRGGCVRITAHNVAKDDVDVPSLPRKDHVKLTVSDNGSGMPANIIPFIFDPFYTTKQVGSGLGLTICYSIIKRHEGHIDVESEPGQGTTFALYLPAAVNPVQSPESAPILPHSGVGRILIMDDEEVIRETTAALCRSLGYTVVLAQNGEEALRILREEADAEEKLCALILDLTIPGGLGGLEVLAKVRRTYARLPVFVVSGYADDPVMAHPINFGFTDSLC
ncbi:PAS domain S-box protein, partial [Myxococcota bacterium]